MRVLRGRGGTRGYGAEFRWAVKNLGRLGRWHRRNFVVPRTSFFMKISSLSSYAGVPVPRVCDYVITRSEVNHTGGVNRLPNA